jgi:hypothetical protein
MHEDGSIVVTREPAVFLAFTCTGTAYYLDSGYLFEIQCNQHIHNPRTLCFIRTICSAVKRRNVYRDFFFISCQCMTRISHLSRRTTNMFRRLHGICMHVSRQISALGVLIRHLFATKNGNSCHWQRFARAHKVDRLIPCIDCYFCEIRQHEPVQYAAFHQRCNGTLI